MDGEYFGIAFDESRSVQRLLDNRLTNGWYIEHMVPVDAIDAI